MRQLKMIFAIGFITLATSVSADVLLDCTQTKFHDLKSVQVVSHENPDLLTVIETDENGKEHISQIDYQQFEEGEVPLQLEWYGYQRTLVRGLKDWSLESQDECSRSYSSVNCIEK